MSTSDVVSAFSSTRDSTLLTTDAAGEGINLQRAHLMVNYDLPWNPNRIEQRFGRIHRIGQTEVCHLWNLVAAETREGAVYQRLLEKIGGVIREREPRRYEITHVPAVLRQRAGSAGILPAGGSIGTAAGRMPARPVGDPILVRYERATFEKHLIAVPGKPLAEFISPGHPLLQAVSDVTLERHRDLLKRGAALVDDREDAPGPRALLCLEHAIQDARTDRAGNRRVVSRQMQFVEIDPQGQCRPAGYAPYLDDRPLRDEELEATRELLLQIERGEQVGSLIPPRPDPLPQGEGRGEGEERGLGFEPTDVSADNRGYDVECRIPNTGKLRSLEVKGRAIGAETITITRNEIMTALNKAEDFILAIVTVDLSASNGPAGGEAADPRYVREPFQREPDFAVRSVNYQLAGLLSRATPPS